jgi:uncharacterized protein (DUF2252 family)
MTIGESTTQYETWLRQRIPVVESQLRDKHERMRGDPFVFLRGTFYRWAQVWPVECADLRHAPSVIAVGDLHVDSFGTWRDVEGRLIFGVDDFDDAYPLPYTNDLVRLATSVKIVIDAGYLRLSLGEACDAIVESYAAALRAHGRPIVLAEEHEHLEKLGIDVLKPPTHFWRTVNRWPSARHGVPVGARRALAATLPVRGLPFKVVRREAGTGSLGQPRYVAVAEWDGGCVAREAKEVVPSACAWAAGERRRGQRYYDRALQSAVRARDPVQRVIGSWLIRRLSPDANPIEIASLPKRRDETMLLSAMATDVANVHLGTPRQRHRVLNDVRRRRAAWLRRAAKAMAKVVEKEWKEYRGA